ncbi:MAG: glucose-6-phosphate isomerase [Candidatus Peregrinibacteria bacterium Gr01-1014_25]|nr:MAG: glucose-6-phosphate isomerase [Candidatus Peregrinibacteria bacterium Gr01-1014_25]
MLHLDISGCLAKLLTPTHGIPDQELTALRTAMRRYVADWLQERRDGGHGWAMTPYHKRVAADVQAVAARAKQENIQTVLWIGIGGSGLGPRVLQEALERPDTPQLIVIDTMDPTVLGMYLDTIDWRHALIVVVSKSGNTLETMSAFFLFWEKLRGAVKNGQERVVAITDPSDGPLQRIATDEGFTTLSIPPDVGGRYSIFTPVGLLPVALLGGDVEAFLRGAKEMDELCQETVLEQNPAALLAAVQFLLDTKRDYPIRVIMPYTQRLASIARWNQQLIAESLGKNELRNPVPLAAIGTQDQHSLLQQWMAGPRTQWHLFIRELEKPRLLVPERLPPPFAHLAGKSFGQLLDACYEGTSRALLGVKRPTATIALTRLDEYHLGQLFFCLLAEVAFLGKLYRIDPYGQPAVEIGKTITHEILSRGRMS